MKKALVILILITYSFATVGTTMHLHYCMNEYVGASLWDGDDTSECGKCGMKEKKGGCCKDEHKAFMESIDTYQWKYEYLCYSAYTKQVVVKII